MILAKRMPQNVRKDVVAMVTYYEQHMEDQLKLIHQLVAENKILKKKLDAD